MTTGSKRTCYDGRRLRAQGVFGNVKGGCTFYMYIFKSATGYPLGIPDIERQRKGPRKYVSVRALTDAPRPCGWRSWV